MTTSGKGRIFISYRRDDSAGYAGRIYDRLTAQFGEDAVFMDVDTIEAGLDFVEVLQNAVQSCDVLVALIGRNWLTIKDATGKRRLDNPEDFVRVEIAAALSRDIRVIPVLVDGAPMPRSTELPGNLKPLARRNALQVDHQSFNADAYRLIAQLDLALKAAEETKAEQARALAEEQAHARKQAEIEGILAQADLAISLNDWKLAQEKLGDVLKLDASHVGAQDKLDIVQRKIAEIERERAEQARREQESRDAEEKKKAKRREQEEHARIAGEEKKRIPLRHDVENREQAERKERERLEAEEIGRKAKEEHEKRTIESEPKIRRESPSPFESPTGVLREGARGGGDKPAWLLYGIGAGVLLVCAILFGIGYLIQKALTPINPPETEIPPIEASATLILATHSTQQSQNIFTETPGSFTEVRITVSVSTNCRSGPGVIYDYLGALEVGEESTVVGRFDINNPPYWIIENPDAPGTCWLWGQYATVTDGSENLPVLIPPPTPILTSIPTLGIGSTMISEKDGMIMVYVPAGEFEMGNTAEKALADCQKVRSDCQLDWFKDEEPPHTVYLDAFWIDQTEVTNAMYARCVAAGECNPPSSTNSYTRDNYYGNAEFDNYPVIYVSWNDASAYCKWADRRLLTEAEWEKAAGWDEELQAQRVYPWGNTFDGAKTNFCDANCSYDWKNTDFDDGYADTAPVGSYPAGKSFYGAYDMAGNVWEWVADWYDVYPGGDKNASSNFGQTVRVLRGGAWYYYDFGLRSADRFRYDPTNTFNGIGFRCSRSP